MKKTLIENRNLLLVTLIAVSIVIGVVPATYAAQPTAQNIATTFIENALPIDSSKYQLILKNQFDSDETTCNLLFTMNSEESTLEIVCKVRRNVLQSCSINVLNGTIISDRQYSDQFDAVKNFLERYQSYSKIDSTKLMAILNDVDITKNLTISQGDTKLTITNGNNFGTDVTSFNWARTINGAEYTSLQVSFQKNGVLYSLRDDRSIYTIGDTSINISKAQAVELALKAVDSYSYELPGDYWVSGFNVTEEYISAKLDTTPENYVLRPYWDIRMPLNQTYPGSVQGLTVFLWANTGEIISVSNMAYGGSSSSDDSTTETVPLSTDAASGDSGLASNLLVPIGIAAAILAVIAVSAVVAVKRKKQQPL